MEGVVFLNQSYQTASFGGVAPDCCGSPPVGQTFLSASGPRVRGALTPAERTRRNMEGTGMSLRRTGRQECLPHQVATTTSYILCGACAGNPLTPQEPDGGVSVYI